MQQLLDTYLWKAYNELNAFSRKYTRKGVININPKKIGKILSGLRNNKKETQVDLAEAIGISSSTIAQYELGSRMPSDEVKIKLANHFGVPVQDIFFREDEDNEDEQSFPADLEVKQMAKKLQEDENLYILFNEAQKATKEDLEIVVEVAKRITKE